MRALDAAEIVLRAAGEPLTPGEITRRALDAGHWTTTGQTPHRTMTAQLAVDIRNRGAASRFVRTAPGRYGLNPNHQPLVPPAPAPPAPLAPPAGGPAAAGKQMSFLNAAEDVLRRSPERRPMHYRAITEQALAEGLIRSTGATPDATMRAQIGVENRRRESRGQRPRFLELGRGLIGLAEWQQQGVLLEIEQHNKTQRAELLEPIKTIHARQFEQLIGDLLSRLDFEIDEITSYGGDGGVDVRARLAVGGVMQVRVAIQAKRWANNVRTPQVRELRGSLGAHERGLTITTSDFSAGARAEAERADAAPVALMSGQDLVTLMVQTELGVNRSAFDVIELEQLPVEAQADETE